MIAVLWYGRVSSEGCSLLAWSAESLTFTNNTPREVKGMNVSGFGILTEYSILSDFLAKYF